MKALIYVLAVFLLCLILTGCKPTSVELQSSEETEEVTVESEPAPAPEALEVVTESTEPKIAEETEEEVAPEVQEEEVSKEEEKEKRIVYQQPDPEPEPTPAFASAELDLSSSTPEEIVIRPLYFDDTGVAASFTIKDGKKKVWVELWKETAPSLDERIERGNEWKLDNLLLYDDIGDCPYFWVSSSNDVIVIPTSELMPFDGEKVAIRAYIYLLEWSDLGITSLGEGSLSYAADYADIQATISKNW